MTVEDYVATGYFLSRWGGTRDCTGIELRRVSLAADHSQRKFFPETWALSWGRGTREDRLAEAAFFGLSENQLEGVMNWADASFDSEFGAWSVFFTLEAAQAAARLMIPNAQALDLWGVGLHRSLLRSYCEASKPPASPPGYAPTAAGGTHIAACVRSLPLAEGGEVLGHELLIDHDGSCFNSPESRHLEEQELFRAVGVVPNKDGLIDSFDDALGCCRHLDSHAAETQHRITGWLPWLIVRYSRP